MIAEPLDNLCFTHRHQIPSIQANIQCLRACTIWRKLMCMSIQQFAAVKRQRLAAELRHIIGPTVCQILPIRVMRKIDRTESLNLNRIVRLQTFEQVKCGAVFQPPVIMVADDRVQMTATQLPQAILMGI